MNILGSFQKLGRALMLPIATLPVAALMLRLGQPDVLDIAFVAAAGDAIFANLALIFALGVAAGLSKDNAGAAALAGAVSLFILGAGLETLNAELDLKILGGIISGVVGGICYNKYSNIKLPEFLGFFGGKRFVPIAAGLVSLVLAFAFSIIWPPVQNAIDAIGQWMVGSGEIGAFTFGFLNRMLIPVGLHHILNSTAWFVFGEFNGATGDLHRFFAGDPTAGMFMTGFFPVMMFGLPAAAAAMYFAAKPENRSKVGGVLASVAFTAFLTGITEPLEFMFMFLAPGLYLAHAVLTGAAMALTHMMGVLHGFGFSAGLIDFALNWGLATNPLMLLPIGAAYAAIYFSLFYFAIKKFDLKTPGREDETEGETVQASDDSSELARQYLAALGGHENLTEIGACITRLRLTCVDRSKVNKAQLKALGAKGVVELGENNLQVILGPLAEIIAGEMQNIPKGENLSAPQTV